MKRIIFISTFLAALFLGACGTPADHSTQPPENSVLASLGLLKTTNIDYTFLNIIVYPQNEEGQLLSVDGILNVEIWSEDISDNSEVIPLQQWDNVPITQESFKNDIGNDIILEYNEFVPELEKQYYVMLTLTVDDISVHTTSIMYLIYTECG